MKVRANGIDIELEDTGGEGRPVVLLIMGLNMQLIAWPDNFVKGLVAAGFRVVRFDNRDAGLSTQFDEAGTRNLLWQGLRYRVGLPVQSAYGLQDMANDAIGVLDRTGHPSRTRARRVDGRHDRAARGGHRAGTRHQPREPDEFQRRARPARPAQRRGRADDAAPRSSATRHRW